MKVGGFNIEYDEARHFIERELAELCSNPAPTIPKRLMDSMAYSLLAGGKRLRPVLCIKAGEIFGLHWKKTLPMALALEMIHTASLIHDDLPAMDDDTLRRGKATNHVLFGDGLAILAGDALMAWAFEHPLSTLMEIGLPGENICKAMLIMAQALGPSGICGGQTLDIDEMSMEGSPDFPWKVARQKTAVLLRASILSGATLAGADDDSLKGLGAFGEHLGAAFQIVDDILDVTSTTEKLGKTPGKDQSQNKMTFVAAYGVEGARDLAKKESALAAESLAPVRGDTAFFGALPEILFGRTM